MNYEDNLFFLNVLIKTLKDGMSLDIDKEYFLDKMVEDIFFIDRTLEKIHVSLKENPLLIKRPEYMRQLLRSKKAFASFLQDIVEGKFEFSAHLEPVFQDLHASRAEHLKEISEIQAQLQKAGTISDDQDIVSEEELKFLLEEDRADLT